MIAIIVAINHHYGIGFENNLLYHLPNDLKHFKSLTTGHTIIMGRKTFESLPKGALPNRRNIVLSRTPHQYPGTECYHSLEEALRQCENEQEIFIIGGAQVYKDSLPLCERLYITEVEDTSVKADTFFPAIDKNVWEEKSRECFPSDEKHLYPYNFVVYERIK